MDAGNKQKNKNQHKSLANEELSCAVEIRELTPKDAEALMTLRLTCIAQDPSSFSVLLSEERQVTRAQVFSMLQRFSRCRCSMLWGAFWQGQLIGMIGLERLYGQVRQHRGIVACLCVQSDCRRSGVGLALVQVLIKYAKTISHLRYLVLEVGAQSTAAIKLYQSVGFTFNGTEPEALCYQGEYIDLYRMSLKL
jgi:ribosomal protein S18 acetylase RimI-like enzyme